MTAALKARLAKLEAKHRKTTEAVGVIGNTPEPYVVEIDGVLHLRFPETPTGETFEVFALRQQTALQAELEALALTEAPNTANKNAPVGNQHKLAPLPKGAKRPRFIEIGGVEIDTLTLRKN